MVIRPRPIFFNNFSGYPVVGRFAARPLYPRSARQTLRLGAPGFLLRLGTVPEYSEDFPNSRWRVPTGRRSLRSFCTPVRIICSILIPKCQSVAFQTAINVRLFTWHFVRVSFVFTHIPALFSKNYIFSRSSLESGFLFWEIGGTTHQAGEGNFHAWRPPGPFVLRADHQNEYAHITSLLSCTK